MYVFNRITVNPQLPKRIEKLSEISNNLWWSWNTEFLRLFQKIDKDLWEESEKNPVKFLKRVSQEKLDNASKNAMFLKEYDKVVLNFDGYMNSKNTWFSKKYPEEKNDLIEQEKKIVIVDLGIKPQTHYSNIQEALQHQATLESLGITLNSLQKQLLTNPFEQQEKSIEELKKNIQVLDDAPIKQIQDDLNHQEVLLKLLNSPSSFIRTTILEKSLEFLNSKIMQYLAQLGSLHIVSFNSDMSLTIEYMGIQYGYVSTGEMGRITLALTLAFRDVWETLNNCKINLFAMDEVIDRIGLDTAGVEMTVQALQTKEDKNVMLVTHNDTLINQAPHLMTLVKENGFTEILK